MRWLVQLRWGALVIQGLVVLVASRLLQASLHLVPVVSLLGLSTLSNLLLMLWLRRQSEVSSRTIGGVLLADISLLTGLLYFSGGSSNPFTIFYLVYVVLAAVVLGPRWSWGTALGSMTCFGALFSYHAALPEGPHQMHDMHNFSGHLYGMWAAFALAAALIAWFVTRLTGALRTRERELQVAREMAAHNVRLAELTTLAAGAAHELSTPLGTILVVASEVLNQAEGAGDVALAGDARLIRQEVTRCRSILDRMGTQSTAELVEKVEEISCEALFAELQAGFSELPPERLHLATAPTGTVIHSGRTSLLQVLSALINNALQASPDGGEVTVGVHTTPGWIHFRVEDHGVGMSEDLLGRVGTPFYSTREPGHGMGLGLFLARVYAERMGGRLLLQSAQEMGTVATLELPAAKGT